MERESFIIYKSFYVLIKLLPMKKRTSMYEAIFEYGFSGELPDFHGDEIMTAMWGTIFPQLKANNARYLNGCKGRDGGALGGAPSGNQNARKNNPESQEETTPNLDEKTTPNIKEKTTPKTTPNENVNENENVNVSNKNAPVRVDTPKKERFCFVSPTLAEVKAYCEERNNAVNAEKFVDFYTAKGWYVGKNRMQDWKAAVRTWENGNEKDTEKWVRASSEDYIKHKYTEEQLNDILVKFDEFEETEE